MLSESLHTIIGAPGATGIAVAEELKSRNLNVRLVSRTQRMEMPEMIQADMLVKHDAIRAIEGSTYVYLCLGLPYKASTWENEWPVIMSNVIEACKKWGAILIFLDNVYMYQPPLSENFSETHSQGPRTRKGRVRKAIADRMILEMESGALRGVIGRSADFYGPHTTNSALYASFLDRMMQGKAPLTLGRANTPHTYAYTPDNAKALVNLALDPATHNQVWHLPVGEPITVEQLTEIMNSILGTSVKASFLSPVAKKILGIFIGGVREANEMAYQFESPYLMSFTKFSSHFPDFRVTPYEAGIRNMINSLQKEETAH